MSLFMIGIIGLAICFALIFLRVPIFIAFGLTGFFGVSIVRGLDAGFYSLATTPYTTMTSYVWTCVPLFILMGLLAMQTGLAGEFYDGVAKWIGHLRGGLATSVIVGNTGFGACTGDSLSAAVTFTTISLPQLRRFNYDDKLTLGSVCAGSVLATFIPPSVPFVLYGAFTSTSIGQLLIAGIIPGLILVVLYISVIYIWARLNPAAAPTVPVATWKERWKSSTGMWALTTVFLVIIVGIFVGLFTPTEAASFGVFTVIVLGLVRRKLSWRAIKTAVIESAQVIGMIGFIFIGCIMFNTFLTVTGVPSKIAEFVVGITTSPIVAMWLIVAIVFLLGCLIDALSLFLLTLPIFYPLAMTLGFTPLHFGVILVAVLSTGGLTPPFGMTVYGVSAVAKDVPIFNIFRGAAPFLVSIWILLALVICFPQIPQFLPSMMLGQ